MFLFTAIPEKLPQAVVKVVKVISCKGGVIAVDTHGGLYSSRGHHTLTLGVSFIEPEVFRALRRLKLVTPAEIAQHHAVRQQREQHGRVIEDRARLERLAERYGLQISARNYRRIK